MGTDLEFAGARADQADRTLRVLRCKEVLDGPLYIAASTNPRSGLCTGQLS